MQTISHRVLLGLAAALLPALVVAAEPDPSDTTKDGPTYIYADKNPAGGDGIGDWTKLLTDEAAGSVSAASMLSISGDSITTVENLRDVVVGLKGLSNDGDAGTLAIAVTPGRTDWSPISFATYANHWWVRPLANLTLGYAQGDTEITDIGFQRRAVSIETSVVFSDTQDIVVAYGTAFHREAQGCGDLYAGTPKAFVDPAAVVKVVDAAPAPGAAAPAPAAAADAAAPVPAPALTPALPTPPGSYDPRPENLPRLGDKRVRGGTDIPLDSKFSKQIQANADSCYESVKKSLRWNAGRASVSYGQAWIRVKDGSMPEESLGRTLAASVSYGFEGLSESNPLKKHVQLAATYRRTTDDPVLESLVTTDPQFKSTSLVSGKIAVGSERLRVLVEASDAKSSSVTASERAFKQAIGIDFRAAKTLWLNLRFGKQRAVDGEDDEVGSMFTISYSPSALLEIM